MIYELPTSVEVNGTEYQIRSDYRPILDILLALDDPELNEQDKALVVLSVFYPDFEDMPPVDYEEAVKKLFWFLNAGEEQKDQRRRPKLVDWQQDYRYIIPPVNRVLGTEVRSIPYDQSTNTGGLHWWTFLGAYEEIDGNCIFSQIVRIRYRRAKGKKLDKVDQEFYRQNRDIVDIKRRYSADDEALVAKLLGKD